jgi:hypothetical protein
MLHGKVNTAAAKQEEMKKHTGSSVTKMFVKF